MRTTTVSPYDLSTNVGALAAQLAQARQEAPPARRGGTDPWREIFIAAAENARYLALGCYTPSPISNRAADVRQLITEVHQYDEQNPLPLGAKMALGVAAAIMGMEIGAQATKG